MKQDHSHDDALIEQYLLGELSGDALKAFELRLQNDQDLAAKIALEKDVHAGIEALGNLKLKAQLQTIHQEELKEAKLRPLAPRWIWAAAAASLLLIASYFLLKDEVQSPQQLFAQNYQAPTFDGLRNNEQQSTLKELYNAGAFTALQDSLNTLIQQTGGTLKDTLLLGICALELDEYPQAQNYFEYLTQQQQLQDDGAWYLALSYLKSGNVELAKEWLQKIVQGQIPATPKRKKQAIELLGKLE